MPCQLLMGLHPDKPDKRHGGAGHLVGALDTPVRTWGKRAHPPVFTVLEVKDRPASFFTPMLGRHREHHEGTAKEQYLGLRYVKQFVKFRYRINFAKLPSGVVSKLETGFASVVFAQIATAIADDWENDDYCDRLSRPALDADVHVATIYRLAQHKGIRVVESAQEKAKIRLEQTVEAMARFPGDPARRGRFYAAQPRPLTKDEVEGILIVENADVAGCATDAALFDLLVRFDETRNQSMGG